MGERLLCKQEVIGSIPFGSTNLLVGTRCATLGADLIAARDMGSEGNAIGVGRLAVSVTARGRFGSGSLSW